MTLEQEKDYAGFSLQSQLFYKEKKLTETTKRDGDLYPVGYNLAEDDFLA